MGSTCPMILGPPSRLHGSTGHPSRYGVGTSGRHVWSRVPAEPIEGTWLMHRTRTIARRSFLNGELATGAAAASGAVTAETAAAAPVGCPRSSKARTRAASSSTSRWSRRQSPSGQLCEVPPRGAFTARESQAPIMTKKYRIAPVEQVAKPTDVLGDEREVLDDQPADARRGYGGTGRPKRCTRSTAGGPRPRRRAGGSVRRARADRCFAMLRRCRPSAMQ